MVVLLNDKSWISVSSASLSVDTGTFPVVESPEIGRSNSNLRSDEHNHQIHERTENT